MKNPVFVDRINNTLYVGNLLVFCLGKRNGSRFHIEKSCSVEFTDPRPTHMQHIDFHIFNYGGYVAWKSDKCFMAKG